jgi:hypothetical protein
MFSASKFTNKLKDFSIILLSFFIIFLLNFDKNLKSDEGVSLYCSENFFNDCIVWDTQLSLFYFWLKISTSVFGFDILIQRVIVSFFVSFSIFLILRTVEIFRKISFKSKIILTICISLIPLYYTLVWVRHYPFSLFFSSLSIYYFFKYVKLRNEDFLKKSFIFDFFGTTFFYFNAFLSLIKILYLRNFKAIKYLTIYTFFLPFIFVYLQNFEIREWGISWYEIFKNYIPTFFLNFPIEFFKSVEHGRMDFIFFILSKFSQAILILPFFSKNKLKILYFLSFLFLIVIEIVFIFFERFIIFSRQFVPITNFILILLLILVKKEFLIIVLPITFIHQTYHHIFTLLFTENIESVYFSIPQNSEILIHPFFVAEHFWYLNVKFKNNITIYDDFPSKNITCLSTRVWISSPPKYIEKNVEYKVVKYDEEFVKKCCNIVIKEFNIKGEKITICK